MKKRNKFLAILLAFAVSLVCVSCSGEESAPITYEQISAAEAKALMDRESGYIIIDARTQSEYDEGHIPRCDTHSRI